MKNIYLLTVALLAISFQSFSQESWSRVKIFGTDAELKTLGTLGLPVDHGEYKANTHFLTDLSSYDIAKLDQHGFNYEIVIQDVKAYYQSERPALKSNHNCGGGSNSFDPVTPANFQQGTMGGFYKYQEYLDEIDSMRSKYPNLITAKSPISTFTTVDGNPIYWMRISDNPDSDEAEPEVLYSSIHHAREPASLSQTIFYMWYMLENYGTDPEVTYLIDNTEMYFVPLLNPDGYIWNETTDPNGGGMHRKNRNLVSGGSGNPGVDLNRNYAYHWDESGTSNNPNNDTWPGVAAFSEVETQAMKWLVEDRDFEFAFNAHTHGNLLLYPIGWSVVEVAPHANYFAAFTDHMVKYNGYGNMKSSGLYPAAGDSDDWMYIDDIGVNHDTIFAMTPEVSSEGGGNDFWPPASAIESICKATVHMNKILSHMPHVFGVTTDLESSKIAVDNGYFSYELERLGRTDGDITINMTAVAGIQSLGTANTHTLSLMEIVEDSISYTLNTGMNFGDDIIYVLETDNGTWTRMDTIYKTYGAGVEIFNDDGSNTNNWAGTWSFTNEEFVSPNNCITDSPFSNYSNNQTKDCELTTVFNLGNGTYAYANFWAQWAIEDNWDYVEFMVSTDGGNSWTPLCGKYTNEGGSNQDTGEPLYDGFQTDWVFEEVDLTDYLGATDVRFKFMLVTDAGVTEDGFYYDDFQIFTDAIDDSGIEGIKYADINIYPNPANDVINIKFGKSELLNKIEILNNVGQIVQTINPTTDLVSISTTELAEGMYFATVYGQNGEKITKRFAVVH